jgi:hypothetical protein
MTTYEDVTTDSSSEVLSTVEAIENLIPSIISNPAEQSIGDICSSDIPEPGTPDGVVLEEESVVESASVTMDANIPEEKTTSDNIKSTRPVNDPLLQAAAVLRLNAVPFAQRDTLLLAMTAMNMFVGCAPAGELSAEIGRLLEAASVPKLKSVADIAGLVRNMEQLGFIEGSSYFENGLEIEVFDLTDTGAALPVEDDGRPAKPIVLYTIERHLRTSRSMQAGTIITIADLVARVITTQTIPLSARMPLFTPCTVREAVIQALTQRFDDRDLLMDVDAGTVTILAHLDPARSSKSLDIW